MIHATLTALERLRLDYGTGAAQKRLALLRDLARTRLATASQVRRLHEALCFIRAYPDDAAVLSQATSMLERFAQRPDLCAHREALADSGIAGTAIHYRFFHAQADWLAAHWPDRLRLDRSDEEAPARIARALPLLVTPVEAQALIEARWSGYEAIDRLRGRQVGDAAFLLRRIAAMPGDGALVPVSYKVVHEIKAAETEPKLRDLVDRLQGDLGGGRLPERGRWRELAPDHQGAGLPVQPAGPRRGGGPLHPPDRDASVATERAVHAEALGR